MQPLDNANGHESITWDSEMIAEQPATTFAPIMVMLILGLGTRKLGRHIQDAAVIRMDIVANAKQRR